MPRTWRILLDLAMVGMAESPWTWSDDGIALDYDSEQACDAVEQFRQFIAERENEETT
jgi:hypothetical protein